MTREELYDFVKDSDFKFVVSLYKDLVNIKVDKNSRPHTLASACRPFTPVGMQVMSAGHAKFNDPKRWSVDLNLETQHYQITGKASGLQLCEQVYIDKALELAQKKFKETGIGYGGHLPTTRER
jgi:hypothetical protein